MKNILFLTFIVFTILNANGQNPMSDPGNSGGWILNQDMSDEFNDATLDKTKWWILGENGDYRSKWKGRAPGQFAPHNVVMDNGDLVLKSQWEPSFTFAAETQEGTWYGGTTTSADKSKPITQACIMSETFFKYGYMEVRCKLADAPVTSAFWTTGYLSEIDMVENYGKRPIGHAQANNPNDALVKTHRTNLISWDPDRTDATSYKTEHLLTEKLASRYFVYGFDWDENGMKIYVDGVLKETKSITQLKNDHNFTWVHDYPQEVWLDAEVFSWYGLPNMADLVTPAEFKIDYVRIWQKTLLSGKDFNALGFEGPFKYSGRSQNWYTVSNFPWKMNDEKPASGDFSVRYNRIGALTTGNQTLYSPYGSIDLPSGSNKMTMKIWIDPATNLNELFVNLTKPFTTLNFSLAGVAKGEWVEISKTFSRSTASDINVNDGARAEIQVRSTSTQSANVLFYIDDISFERTTLAVNKANSFNFEVFPNPAKENIKVNSEQNCTIQIFNNLGVTVRTFKNALKSQIMSVENLATGLYFVKVSSGQKSSVKKIVIQ
ncbi:T9SS type A sorting domain-containing protein [Algibacter sp.]|uniref:T9SS type A sorting domain-containing protein n=1 Tax=Algibacter sp. TaxID=1872428 RepID=UPI003C76F5F9